MNKLKLIIKREFLAKVRNRSFIIMTFVSPLIMAGMIALVVYLSKSSMEKINVVAYVDNSKFFSKKDFKDSNTIHYINLTEVNLDKAKKIVQESNHDGSFHSYCQSCIQANRQQHKQSQHASPAPLFLP